MIKKKIYYQNNKDTILEKGNQYREQNKETINLKQKAFWRLNALLKKHWTVTIGKDIISAIDGINIIYKTNQQKIIAGLDITEYHHRELRKLHQLALLYSQQFNKIQDTI